MTINKLKIYFLIYSILFGFRINAQNVAPLEPCGYQYEIKKTISKTPNFLTWQNEWYKIVNQEYKELQSAKRRIVADTEFYEIEVVFHVIYNDLSQNISSNLIVSQLNELNLDFRKLNSDTSRIRSIFKSLATDVKIQFKLATKDPQGNATDGINRINTSIETFAVSKDGNYNENHCCPLNIPKGILLIASS